MRTELAGPADATGTERSVLGVVSGNDPRTTANAPATRGVEEPQSDVNSEMPFVPGTLFRKFSARR